LDDQDWEDVLARAYEPEPDPVELEDIGKE
jgi:hypothetical protein